MQIQLKEINDVKKLISITRKYKSDIDLVAGHYCVDAKSIMGVFSIDSTKITYIRFIAKDNEKEADFCNELTKAGLIVA